MQPTLTDMIHINPVFFELAKNTKPKKTGHNYAIFVPKEFKNNNCILLVCRTINDILDQQIKTAFAFCNNCQRIFDTTAKKCYFCGCKDHTPYGKEMKFLQ